jgi:Transcriptional regulators
MEQLEIMDHILRLSRATRRKPSGKKERHHDKKEKSHSQRKLIRYIIESPGCKTSELAFEIDLRPSSMTELLDNLENSGDIIRKKDENDNRVTLIYPSQQLLDRVHKRKEEREKSQLDLEDVLTEEEKKEFNRLCNKIYDYLSNHDNEEVK